MAMYTVHKGVRYRALSRSAFRSVAATSRSPKSCREVGFTEVTVTGSGP